MNEGKVIVGAVCLVIALYVFTSMESPAKELGAAILGIAGLVYLIAGLSGQ
jgi:hypothetical protein